MKVSLAPHVNLYVFPVGRRLFALSQVHNRAARMGLPDIVSKTQQAVEHDRITQRMFMQRRATPQARFGAEARRLDNELDSCVVGLDSYLASQVRMFTIQRPKGKAASVLRRALFSDGVAAITSMSYVQEHEAVDALIARLGDGDLAQSVAVLPDLIEIVDHMRALNTEFGRALEADHASPTPDEVRAAQARGQELLVHTMVLIMAHHARTGDEQATMELLEPILMQNNDIREARKRRRPAADVDPDTGDEVDEGDEDSPDGIPEPGDEPFEE